MSEVMAVTPDKKSFMKKSLRIKRGALAMYTSYDTVYEQWIVFYSIPIESHIFLKIQFDLFGCWMISAYEM